MPEAIAKYRRNRAGAARLLVLQALLCLTLACSAQESAAPPPPPPPPPPQAAPIPSTEIPEPSAPAQEAEPEEEYDAEVAEPEPAVEPPLRVGPPPAAIPTPRPVPPAEVPPSVLVDKDLRYVQLFYGTNRARTAPCARVAATRWDAASRCWPNVYYDGVMAADAGDGAQGLEVGTLEVTFPPEHSPGKIERPLRVFSFTLEEEDPDEHVVISEIRSYGTDHAAWVRDLQAAGRDQAFIYVHGFQTSFAQAAQRAAQIAYDLDFDLEEDFRGVPMFFSWPSRGGVDAYGVDYDTSFESIDAFNRFLDLVKKQAGIRRVHIIAHSMGNRVVAEALYARRDGAEPIVDQLVLAAPDVWASRFKSRFLRTLPNLASRVTLYVSDKDRALITSSGIRKGEPRAGEVAGGLLEASRGIDRFDAINASTLSTDFLGHSYYASHGSMLGDIYCLFKGTPAKGRPLLVAAGSAWQFRAAEELAKIDAATCLVAAPPPVPAPTPPPLPVSPASSSPAWLVPVAAILVGAALLAMVLLWLRRRSQSPA